MLALLTPQHLRRYTAPPTPDELHRLYCIHLFFLAWKGLGRGRQGGAGIVRVETLSLWHRAHFQHPPPPTSRPAVFGVWERRRVERLANSVCNQPNSLWNRRPFLERWHVQRPETCVWNCRTAPCFGRVAALALGES